MWPRIVTPMAPGASVFFVLRGQSVHSGQEEPSEWASPPRRRRGRAGASNESDRNWPSSSRRSGGIRKGARERQPHTGRRAGAQGRNHKDDLYRPPPSEDTPIPLPRPGLLKSWKHVPHPQCGPSKKLIGFRFLIRSGQKASPLPDASQI
jgi:hypothetical protein